MYLLSLACLPSFCADESVAGEPGMFFIYLSTVDCKPSGFPVRLAIEVPLPSLVAEQDRRTILELCDAASRDADYGAFFAEGSSVFYRLVYPLYTPDVLDRFIAYRLIGEASRELTSAVNRMLSRLALGQVPENQP